MVPPNIQRLPSKKPYKNVEPLTYLRCTTSLNSLLLTESNLINNLVGVLRFYSIINRYWTDVLLISYMRRPQGYVTLPMAPEQ